MTHDQIIIYSDGACSGNPGPGGWGSIVIDQHQVIELGGGDYSTTNNRMEMTATLEALKFCLRQKTKAKRIIIFTDSVYVIRGITQWIFGWKKRGWKNAENGEVSNQDIWIDFDQVVQAIKAEKIELKWNFIKGHSGVPGNERCDEIAVAFSKNTPIRLYSGNPEGYIFNPQELPTPLPLPEMKNNKNEEKKPTWYLSYINGVLTRHETWKECEAVVKGRPAKFKKVTSQAEEDEVKKSWGIG